MNARVLVTLTYDKTKDGDLNEFKKKYEAMREHFNRLQAKGVLPRGVILFKFERAPGPKSGPEGDGPLTPKPGVVIPFNPTNPASLLPVHCSGQRLDITRIAM